MVKLETQEQADLIHKALCTLKGRIFNVVYDINGDPFITNRERDECDNREFAWVKDLKEVKFIEA